MSVWPPELKSSLARIVQRVEAVRLQRMGEPMVRHIDGKLSEMQASGRRVEGRALYVTVIGRRIVIVHAFQKTTQKTPRSHIDVALRRAKTLS